MKLPLTVVFRRDRHHVMRPELAVQAHGFDPKTFQVHLVPDVPYPWIIWRVYSSSAVVDTIERLTGRELTALETQSGVSGVWD